MRSDAVVQNLLVLYAGAALINALFAAALWRSTRDRLFRSLFIAWGSTIVSTLAQGALVGDPLLVSLGFSTVFLNNAAFAHLLAALTNVKVPWRALLTLLAAALATSWAASAAGADFTFVALPTTIAVAAPALAVAVQVITRRWRTLQAQVRALTLACLVFSAHNLDFAFLRMRESAAPLGFTVAILIVFAISISAPAALLEQVTQRQTRLAAQLDIARTLQAHLVPADARLDGLDFAAHMRQADSVGGDYLHCFRSGGVDWFFVGDVTGHGFGAGLLTLMAHSTVASIIEARPEASPRQLNELANRVLCNSLAQLEERRFMTVVAIRRDGPQNRLVVSGSHEDLLVYRAAARKVDVVPVAHFPLGLGFTRLEPQRIGEATIDLSPGDLVFIGTDGVFEAPREGDYSRGLFGVEQVAQILAASGDLSLAALKKRLLERLDAFTGGQYEDDVAFLLLRARGEEQA